VTQAANRAADDPTHDKLVYIWDFGEGGARTVNAQAVNLPAAWNNMNVGYGKRPAHVYETPGTYTVTCTCRELDGTLIGTDTFQVTVQDPDAVFTGSRTILVGSADANYPGATVTGSFSTAWNALKGLGQSGRILVARGSDLTVGVNLTTSNANQNVYVGAYGSGADPILRTGSSGANETPMFAAWAGFNSDFTFWNLDLRGNWDSTNETGRPYQGVVFSMDGNSTKRLTISGCSFDGFAINVRHDGNTANTSIMSTVHKTNITNWQNYGVFVIQNYNGCFNIIGSAIHQDENAMMGGGLKNVDRNDHGPVRMSYPGYCYVAAPISSRATHGRKTCLRSPACAW
jgi:PKD repeat protein